MTREVGERVNSKEKGKKIVIKVGEDDEEVEDIVNSTEKGEMKDGEYDWEVDDIVNSTEKGEMKVGESDWELEDLSFLSGLYNKSNSDNEDFVDVELNKDLRNMQNPSTEDALSDDDDWIKSSGDSPQNPIDLSFDPPTTDVTPIQSRKRKHATPVTTPVPPQGTTLGNSPQSRIGRGTGRGLGSRRGRCKSSPLMLDLHEKFAAVDDSNITVQYRQLKKEYEDLNHIHHALKNDSVEHEKKLKEVIASKNSYRTCGMDKSETVIERVKVKEVKVEVEDFHASQASVVRCNARLGIVEEALILHQKACKKFLDVAKIVHEKMDALSTSQVVEVPALEETQPLAVSTDPPIVEVPIDTGNSLLNPPNSVLPPIIEGDGTGA